TSVYTSATAHSCAKASSLPTTAGGIARTATSAAPLASRRSGTTVPAPRSAASLAVAGSASLSQTSAPFSRSASATDVPISPVPATRTRLGMLMVVAPRPLLGDVLAEADRAAEVDVLDLRAGAFGFHVCHEADHAGHRPRDGDLRRAHQRHGVEA